MPVVDSIWPVTEVYTYTYGPVENMGLFQIVEIVGAGFWDLGWVLVFGGEGGGAFKGYLITTSNDTDRVSGSQGRK